MKPLKPMKHGHVTYVWLTSQTAVREIIFLLKVAHEKVAPFLVFWSLFYLDIPSRPGATILNPDRSHL